MHLLMIHGNLYDLVPLGNDFVSFNEFLERWLGRTHGLVFYNRSLGPRFMDPAQERVFQHINHYRADRSEEDRLREDEALDALGEPARTDETLYERNPTSFLGQMDHYFRHIDLWDSRPVAFVVEFAETIVPQANLSSMHDDDRTQLVTLLRWATDPKWRAAGHMVVLLASNIADIHHLLLAQQYGGEVLLMPLPDREARRNYLEYLQAKFPISTLDLDFHHLAHLTAGLTLMQIGLIWQQMKRGDLGISSSEIQKRKQELFKKELGELIEIIEPHHTMDQLGGLDTVKNFFRRIIAALAAGQTLVVPRGMTLMGPPGVGKTALAEAMAHEAGFNFIKIINPREKWVGQSERNFWKVLQTVRALTPVVVVEDEADQSESMRDQTTADSGVSSRMRQMRFEFTSDPRLQGKVLWLRITNRPDLLDPADLRSGRSSERIPFFLPEPVEIPSIFETVARKLNLETDHDVEFEALANLCVERHKAQLAGADIEEISLRAYRQAIFSGRNKVSQKDYEWAIHDFLPPHSSEYLRNMELLAASQCSSRQFLSPRYLTRTGTN
jgi:SpoVK/Ycf46/Vps4 family AAA+-type ATPase